MEPAALTLHFRNLETLRNLERAAEALGLTTGELAEAAIERELVAVGASFEGRLARAFKRLESYGPEKLAQDFEELARSEAEVEDPLQARCVEASGPEVERLVDEVAALTGESKTEAVRRSLVERRARLTLRSGGGDRYARLLHLLERNIWPSLSPGELGAPAITKEEQEEILGLGPEGV